MYIAYLLFMVGDSDTLTTGKVFSALLADIITYLFVVVMTVLACCFLRKSE